MTKSTFSVQLLIDYSDLHEHYGWLPPTEIEAYDLDPETGEYANPQYWVTPWTEEEERVYKIESVIFFYNFENGTNIHPDDVKSFSEVKRTDYCSTFEFTV